MDKFLFGIEILSYGRHAGERYGKILAYLEKQGTPIGAYDMMIAAHALSENLTIITNNLKEFQRIKDLKVESWAE